MIKKIINSGKIGPFEMIFKSKTKDIAMGGLENNGRSKDIILPNAIPNMATSVMIKGIEMTLLCFFKFLNLLLAYYLTDQVIKERYE
jgi:hypothetical protein